jgi:hypothetical protein
MKVHRILESGEPYWVGTATSVDHAIELAYDGSPGSLVLLTVQIWERPAGKRGSCHQWVTLWSGSF